VSAVAADAPVSWWRLDESAGTVAADHSSANAGTYLAGTTLKASSLLNTDPLDPAVTFDGVKGAMRVASSSSLNLTAPFSLEAWIRPTKLPPEGSFFSVLSKAESYSLQFNGPKIEFTVIQSGTRRRLQAPTGTIVAGNTYYVVGTFDGSTQRLYVNGSLLVSRSQTGTASVTSNPLYLGSWSGSSEFFPGTIDEAAVYNKVLGASAVASHYNAATTG
jgi:large repetitive protein